MEEYEVSKWYPINSKEEYAGFIHYFVMSPLEGEFQYKYENDPKNKRYYRNKKYSEKVKKEYIDSGLRVNSIRFVPN
ncbi:hypothetical protein MmiEs2_00610 [Methanimicrococcus stummii]|uniref:Uncharacterized protein n=1 Tax=Methanimicrococcus stummii TaxID=3028294 RepID=A0AA96V7A9_9EURY|nr:hypothetical protein [Methanimicrococcus sp. Es2]WNY27884.1 hypothetical protein MmiEs2_00610 [Methanimicrococcus sp. Es2]